MSQTDFDIIIIGAGPAGLSFARSLADLSVQVLLLEKSSLATLQTPPEDGREIALTHLSVRLLKSLGVWQHLPADAISPIEGARVFDGESSYSLDFDKDSADLEALGYLVPNHEIRQACFEAVKEQPNLTIRTEVVAEDVSTDELCGRVVLNTGEALSARLVVAADTRFSETRRKMGLSATLKDFSRTAIVCRMAHTRAHQQTAFECFHYGRTTAILPMNGDRSSIVVTVNSREANHYAQMPEAQFNQAIEQQLQGLLGEMQLLGKRHVYPLVAVHANQFVARRFALIGDAAVGMHPVTAHGFNLGLRGQATLAELLQHAQQQGMDVGDETLLREYEREQMRVTRVLYHGTNWVVGLFTNETMAARLARKATLRLANTIKPVKQLITASLTENELHRGVSLPVPPGLKPLQSIAGQLQQRLPEKAQPTETMGAWLDADCF